MPSTMAFERHNGGGVQVLVGIDAPDDPGGFSWHTRHVGPLVRPPEGNRLLNTHCRCSSTDPGSSSRSRPGPST